MAEHEQARSGDERRARPPLHVECQMFVTEESRVAVRHVITLMTPENIQVVERWLDRLKKAESSAWDIFVRSVKVGVFLIAATILYQLTQAEFVSWLKKIVK